MRNQVMKVPKRRPPRPHSFRRLRSPLRQWAAAKPSQVIKANKTMKTISAVQFTSATASPPRMFSDYVLGAEFDSAAPPLMGDGEIDNRGQDGAEDDPEELVPVEKRHADKRRLN